MLRYCRGLFAFVLWDDNKKALLLVRDSFGIKPLYYSDSGRQIMIASQVKALLKSNSINTDIEPAGHVGYFLLGHVPEPYTLYKNIRALPSGSYLWVDAEGARQPVVYFDIRQQLLSAQHSKITRASEAYLQLETAISDSVSSHLVADVPVGVFLSSGIDSALITALAAEQMQQSLQTITLGFQEYRHTNKDETPLAEQIAAQYGTAHVTATLSKNDISADMKQFFMAMDQPTIDGLNTYYVSKVTAESGLKVALSGVGADELFGGYNNFRRIPQFVRWCHWAKQAGLLSRLVRRVTQPVFRYLGKEKYAGLFEYAHSYSGAYFLLRALQMPFQIFDVMDTNTFSEGWDKLRLIERLKESINGLTEQHLIISGLELQWYMRNQLLRDTDWAGMAHSLEIRVPYVDAALFSKTASLYTHIQSKRDCIQKLNTRLPSALFERTKTGFNVPIHEWRGNMRSWASTIYQQFVN